MKVLKNIWRFLNGNKTIIGQALVIFGRITLVKAHVHPDILLVTDWVGATMAAGGIIHHISKGYFSKKVGNQGQIMDDPLKEPKLKNSNVQK